VLYIFRFKINTLLCYTVVSALVLDIGIPRGQYYRILGAWFGIVLTLIVHVTDLYIVLYCIYCSVRRNEERPQHSCYRHCSESSAAADRTDTWNTTSYGQTDRWRRLYDREESAHLSHGPRHHELIAISHHHHHHHHHITHSEWVSSYQWRITQNTSYTLYVNHTADNAHNPLGTFPRNFPRRCGSCQFVGNKSLWWNLGNDTTQQTQRTFAHANLLQTCYRLVVYVAGLLWTW